MKCLLKISLIVTCFIACVDDNKTDIEEIKIGQQEVGLTEVFLNPLSEKKLILSGGDKKYRVNVEDSRIASATISQDTLKIKSYEIEGKTFAKVFSHDKEVYLDISVVPNKLSFSANELFLRPSDIDKSIALSGGGRIVTLEENDPNDIIDVKWNNSSGLLEVKAKYEGVASVVATSKGVESKELKIKIKSLDDNGYLNNIGLYSSNRVNIGQIINPVLIVKRKEMGTLISSMTNLKSHDVKKVLVKPIISPVIGETINVDITANFQTSNFSSGNYTLFVEEINNAKKIVILQGKGFKLVAPFI